MAPLITKQQLAHLRANGLAAQKDPDFDPVPVVKIFTPDAQATWLITESLPGHDDMLFGLCDLGLGNPEMGSVDLGELYEVRGGLGLPVERDLHFTPDKRISEYARIAAQRGKIVT